MRPHRLVAALAAIFVLVAIPRLVLAEHVPPSATIPHDNTVNQASYWDGYFGLADGACEKLNESGNTAFVMPPAPQGKVWYALVVKQAQANFVYPSPVVGHSYPSVGGQAPGYSHLIVCAVPSTSSSTSSTSTTEATTSTTTTTPETTTTVESTTTTSSPTSTTTSTSTTIQESSSTTDPVTATLPFTGADQMGAWAGLASVLLVAGLALLARERQER